MRKDYAEGTFLPTGRGFQFSAAPPADLLDERFLRSKDPEEIVLAVLQHVRNGDFSRFPVLTDLLARTNDAYIWNCCDLLIAFAAPYSFIRGLLDKYSDSLTRSREGHLQEWFSLILGRSCGFWAVPRLLEILLATNDRNAHGVAPIYLSFLLEPTLGPIYWGPKLVVEQRGNLPRGFEYLADDEPPKYNDAEYSQLVKAALDATRGKLGTRDPRSTAIHGGDTFLIRRLVEQALERIAQGKHDELLGVSRLLFEAYTGIDCTGFYNENAVLKPLVASDILERFLDSGRAETFQPGVRYFFGHRIPD
jgi:hypothetical protein